MMQHLSMTAQLGKAAHLIQVRHGGSAEHGGQVAQALRQRKRLALKLHVIHLLQLVPVALHACATSVSCEPGLVRCRIRKPQWQTL